MPPLLLFFGILCGILAGILSLSARKLVTFGGPQLRRLRENHPELAERCQLVLERKPSYQVALQMEAALLWCAAIVLFTLWFQQCGATLPIRWLAIALAFLLTACLFLTVERLLSLSLTARLLLGTRAYAVPFLFLGYPFQKLDETLDERTPDTQEDTVTTEDAIRSLVEQDDQDQNGPAALEDDLAQEEKRMLTGVMDLDNTLVHEIMTPRVDMDVISQDATVAQAKATIARNGHSRIPVFGKSIDAITGILYAKDLLDDTKAAGAATVRDFARPPIFIPETKNVADLLKEFRSKHNHMAVVLDEYGGTSGIVTIEDILEEIVGEIEDEFDREAPAESSQLASDGSMTTDARAAISDINQTLGLKIPEDEGYDTLAGYIMTELGRIPKTGEVIDTPALQAEILCASPRRLITLKVRKPITPPDKD